MALGMRVLRGPDWEQSDADGGEGHLGTVVRVKADEGMAEVVWDNGQVTKCRVGKESKHDLRIYDNATVGIMHPDVTCIGCVSPCIRGLRWRCALCPHINLCSRCYVIGVHDVKHPFRRFTTPTDKGVSVGRRSDVTRVRLQGLFLGARVVRGPDWQCGDADGGAGTRGVVVDMLSPESGSARNAVRVSWDSGQSLQHRLGLHGKVDLVCTEEAPGPACYVSHLPVLAEEHLRLIDSGVQADRESKAGVEAVAGRDSRNVPSSGMTNIPASDSAEIFKEGDIVRIVSDARLLEEQQDGHGGWTPDMALAVGRVGKVEQVSEKGDVMVKFGQEYWVFNPKSCRPAPGSTVDCISFRGPQGALKGAMESLHKGLMGGKVVDRMKEMSAPEASSASLASLWSAVSAGDVSTATQLIGREPSLVQESCPAGTALHCACSKGQLEMVRLLVAKGARVNAGDKDDDTPLHCAIHSGHMGVAAALIEMGADVNLSNEDGRTPLHMAVAKNSSQAVSLLLQHRASVNRRDIRGNTPMHEAIQKDTDPCIIDALLAVRDLDFSVVNKLGFNPLQLASKINRVRTVEKILARDASLVASATEGRLFTALHSATMNNNLEIMEALIKANAPLNARNNVGQTPLHIACSEDNFNATKMLVECGADINATDAMDNTPLLACLIIHPMQVSLGLSTHRSERGAIAVYLIHQGARTDIRNKEGRVALDAAPSDIRPLLEDAIRKTRNSSSAKGQTEWSTNEDRPEQTTSATTTCAMCHQRDADVILPMCGHKLLCRQCAENARKCPQCGKDIEGLVKAGRTPGGQPASTAAEQTDNEVQECKVQ